MKTIFVFLTTGFEEIEAIATIDVLRRAGLAVRSVSITGEITVTGSHGVPVTADMLLGEVSADNAEMLVLPLSLIHTYAAADEDTVAPVGC